MNPGRELDALVAEKVMNKNIEKYGGNFVEVVNPNESKGNYPVDYLVPHYSIDIAAAWEVVESGCFKEFKISNNYFLFNRNRHAHYEKICAMRNLIPMYKTWNIKFRGSRKGSRLVFGNRGKSAPHAICLAALKAIGADVETD